MWEGVKNVEDIIEKIKFLNNSKDPLIKIVSQIIPYVNDFISSPFLKNDINWNEIYITTLESIICICIDN